MVTARCIAQQPVLTGSHRDPRTGEAVKVSVLLIAANAEMLVDTVRALDRQSLGREDYHVSVLLTGTNEQLARRVRSLSGRRTNVSVLDATSVGLATLVSDILDGANDDVLVVPVMTGTVLHSETLRRLAEAAAPGLAVSGRRSGDGSALPVAAPSTIRAPLPVLAAPAPLAREASADVTAGDEADWLHGWQEAVLDRAKGVEHLAAYPAVRGSTLAATPGLEVAKSEAAWADGRLELSVRVRRTALCAPGPNDRLAATFVLHERRSGVEYPFVAEATADGESVQLTGGFDLSDVAFGEALPGGEWSIGFDLATGTAQARGLVPACTLDAAVVSARPVVRSLKQRTLTLQVDRIRRNFITADPATAQIVESVSGTAMTLPLANLHVTGAEPLTGDIFLGGLRLRATIRASSDGPVLEGLLSGLAGEYPVGSRFGIGVPTQTGLVLVVDGVGKMRLAGAQKAVKAAPATQPPIALLHRLRAAVPDTIAKALGRRGGRG